MDVFATRNYRIFLRVGSILVIILFCAIYSKSLFLYLGMMSNTNPPEPVLPYRIGVRRAISMMEAVNETLIEQFRNADTVVYNRVSKCGSSLMVSLIREIQKKKKFRLISSKVYMKRRIPEEDQRELAWSFVAEKKPWLFERHLHFVDFNRYGLDRPIYFNLIRDPLERFTSAYYYDRNPKRSHKLKIPKETINMTMDECVRSEMPACSDPMHSNNLWNMIPYFCGQYEICSYPNTDALSLAKHNVERHFAVVGLLEYMDTFLKLLEKTLPQYFNGIYEIYNRKFGKTKQNVTEKKPKAKPETVEMLKRKMSLEYEFYHYIRQRIHNHELYFNYTITRN